MSDPASKSLPRAGMEPAARRLVGRLPTQVKAVLGELLELMARSARDRSIPVTRTELVAHRDPEEGTEKLVIRQWVDLPREMAMDYWDEMGKEIDAWVDRLPEPSADLLTERIAFTVCSDLDDAAA